MLMPIVTTIVGVVAMATPDAEFNVQDPQDPTVVVTPIEVRWTNEEEEAYKSAYDRTVSWTSPAPFVLWEIKPIDEDKHDDMPIGWWEHEGKKYDWNGSQITWHGTPGGMWWGGRAEDYWMWFPKPRWDWKYTQEKP